MMRIEWFKKQNARPNYKINKEKGFTLLDLMLVIIILSITGLIVLPKLSGVIASEKVQAATREMLGGIMYAENLSLLHGRPFGVRFVPGTNTFEVFDKKFMADSSPHHESKPPVDIYGIVLNPYDQSWYQFNFDDNSMTRGVSLIKDESITTLVFYPDGHGNHLSATITLQMDVFSRHISISGISGRIDVQ